MPKRNNLREEDEVQTEWSQVSYDLWCRDNATDYFTVPEVKAVNIYEVVNSVIDNDFTPAEQKIARLNWFENLSPAQIAKMTNTTTPNVYQTLSRARAKIKLVLKHIIDCPAYRFEKEF